MSDWNFKKYGEIDVSVFIEKLSQFQSWDNDENLKRKKISTHSACDIIPIMFAMDQRELPVNVPATKSEFWDEFYDQDFFEKLQNILIDKIGNGYFIHILIINLPAGKKIIPHKDLARKLQANNRIHIPIVTADGVIFTVNGESRHMKTGEIIEIANEKMHSVENNSDIDRIHLLVDWYCKPAEE